MTTLDQLGVTTVRMLAVDQVEQANSGHPGLPLGLAPTAYTLFSRILRFDPENPNWANRDRFILSPGHGSAMLYALLHLFGYDLPLHELERFRQLGSLTPGHPEYRHTPGVEVTTGPLGQGIATAVGLAVGERRLANHVERRFGDSLIDHHTFVLVSDGDLMEGISHEAASLAGHLGLGKLIVAYDSNNITIDGPAGQSCSDDVAMRFRAYGWHVTTLVDPEDLDEIEAAFRSEMELPTQPSLIVVPTVIGYGSPHKQGTSGVHGSPLGDAERSATKAFYHWPDSPTFWVPAEVRTHVAAIISNNQVTAHNWHDRASRVGFEPTVDPHEKLDLDTLQWPTFDEGKVIATRVASREVLAALTPQLDWLIGGSADLAESTGLTIDMEVFDRDHPGGSIFHFGIREHAMAAMANGLALYGGLHPYISTFLVFSDYLRPALRLSAIMGLEVTYIFTHDSIAVGEDGPTHQPIEQIEALRIIPNLCVLRPADSLETVAAWHVALTHQRGPVALILTRQGLPTLADERDSNWLAEVGARMVGAPDDGQPEVVLIASGSEVSLCLEAQRLLRDEYDITARIISVPWRERFLALAKEEQDQLAPAGTPRLIVEAGVATGWAAFCQPGDRLYNMTTFGTSGPGTAVQEHFGFSASAVAVAAVEVATDGRRLGLPRHLVSDLLAATEAAAIAAQPMVGLGDRNGADAAAVEAMRDELSSLPMAATVIVGEGEKDRAPMLFVGERLGIGNIDLDLAVDPVEGTHFAASGREGAVSVIAAAPGGGFRPLPGYYLEKLVVHADAAGAIDITRPLIENVHRVAERLGRSISETGVIILAKPRHSDMITALRRAGIPVIEISDGDIMASLRVLIGDPRIAIMWGIGGTPEGIITAAATLALAGEMKARLAPQLPEEHALLDEWRSDWSELIFDARDLAHPESIVVATSITGAAPLAAPRPIGDGWEFESLWIEPGHYGITRRLIL
ncbi:MAG: transketolase [Ferrimicrobium sp.]